jgi:hypothetical protein
MRDSDRDGFFSWALQSLEVMGCVDVTIARICSVAEVGQLWGCFDISEREDASCA